MRWKLWARDTFDRETPPAVEAAGDGIVEGLRALWTRVLCEGVRDDGQATFTRFTLEWGDGGFADVRVEPFDNHALARLRGFIYGEPGPYEGGSPHRKPRSSLLDAVADAHARLLDAGDASLGIFACTDAADADECERRVRAM